MFALIIMACFFGGILLGKRIKTGKKGKALLDRFFRIGVLLLVFMMGMSLGSDDALWEKLASTGAQALVFGLLTAFLGGTGAFLAGMLLEKRHRSREDQS